MNDKRETVDMWLVSAFAILVVVASTWMAVERNMVDVTPHVHVKAKVYFNNLKYYNSTYCLTLSDENTNILVEKDKHIETKYMVVTR